MLDQILDANPALTGMVAVVLAITVFNIFAFFYLRKERKQ